MGPEQQAEFIKEAARIDPTTGRLPEHEDDPSCDHCDEHPWTVELTFRGEYNRTRKLCTECAGEVLAWI